MSVRPAKTQISLGIRPVWSESSLSARRNLGPLATHWAQSEDSDQTSRMPRLIWVFAGRTLILLVLSCRGSKSQQKAQEVPQTAANHRHKEEETKDKNEHKTNKQMQEKHTDELPLPQTRRPQC